MTADARLTALRLVGFKSFAERTLVDFGPGISAIVGPNGSGKSNLADALRWTLGEAGRSLRTRRAEDVIFAGSSVRRAIGMADVTLVIDNRDRLLPVDYEEVELGRRLYRSGENEYLLNRQRIRLRDLTEMLDAGNLADNAFLFIGQGMVDQALALRPEERRPLFEEAAGVRRHERRRRQAEAELAEAETNLERVRDLLVELRPQARRLAAQAEQLVARRTAGLELAEALAASARTRWGEASEVARGAQAALDAAHREADAAMSELRTAEEEAERLSRALGERADVEQRRRAELDRLREGTLALRLQGARGQSELEALARDRERHAHELAAIDARMAAARMTLAEQLPPDEVSAADELERIDREIAELERESLAEAQAAGTRAPEDRMAVLQASVEELRRDSGSMAGSLAQARERAADVDARVAAALGERDAAIESLGEAAELERRAEEAAGAARAGLEDAIAAHSQRTRELNELDARRGAAEAQAEALDSMLGTERDEPLRRAARARGGSLAAEGLEVDQRFRAAVAAALREAVRALAVPEDAVGALNRSHGVLVLADASFASRPTDASLVERSAAALDGGLLAAAVRRDPQGHVTRLLARTAWTPDLEKALLLRSSLPAGWSVAALSGELVSDDGVVRLGVPDPYLDQKAQRHEVDRVLAELRPVLDGAASALAATAAASASAETRTREARANLDEARRRHRVAQESERLAQRRADTALREQAWQRSELERVAGRATDVAARLADAESELAAAVRERAERASAADDTAAARAVQTAREKRRAELAARRGRIAETVETRRASRQTAEEARRRAEITLAFDEARTGELDAEAERLAGREAELAVLTENVASELARAEEREAGARRELDELVRADVDERARLQAAERMALQWREKLRGAESRSRSAEVSAMEGRLQLEQIREHLLVELAGIGPDGLFALRSEAGLPPASEADLAPDVLGSRLEDALTAALERWVQTTDDAPAPAQSRLAALRRRFHELGAGNPFAATEYEEVRGRLDEMEAQRADLESAIASTRELIANLSALITDQFRRTFTALEDAFARRFNQLFDGGEAQLTLTAPDDLSATGVEITARPPGKKRQPLAMLSGGERALTAVALLLAMLEVRPVPFCVLDEVDAALDEANVARFSAALRSLADRIQFVVITHNRGTIEAADALYGVTIGEDAASRVISLRLPGENGHSGKATEGVATEGLATEAMSAMATSDG